MKGPKLLLIFVCALAACGRDSSSASDGGVSDMTDGSAKKRSTEPVAVSSGSSLRRQSEGVVGGTMGSPAPPAFSAAPTEEVETQGTGTQATTGADPFQNLNAATSGAPSMLIRTGQAFIEVEKVDAAVLRIRQLAAQVGGYVTNSSMSGGRDQIRQATVELKIPAAQYEQAVGSLSTIGKVETVNTTAQDVGEEFVDVTARVHNARRLEERLITLLSTRTGKLDEVLRVERELARVREEIERYEGRLRYLTSRVALSTLSITVHEPSPILGNNPGENPIAAAFRRAWRNFVALIAAVIASLGVIIPLGLIAAAGWFGYRRWRATKR
ncbi:MAG TPA: DUF4349 domain-containing protein [Gemmatimonadaceae bacterium]|nr:DUF4349 domain-containing protein [Gemmatimonadaceae bacterium]